MVNKYMFQWKKYFLIIVLGVFVFHSTVWAVDIGIDPGGNGMTGEVAKNSGFDVNGVTDTTLSETVGRIIKSILALLGTIFFALMVYAGILWTTAGGNDEQVTRATTIISNASIGLVIVLAAYGITVFIMLAIMTSTSSTTTAPQNSAWTFFKNNWARLLL